MIKRAHIRQFLAVVDGGSFTQAAQRIRVTQPALSTGIAELEKLVGTPLFIRNRRQIRLTEAGGRFLPIARDLERGFRTADGFGRAADVRATEFKLGVIRSVSSELLQAVVAPFRPGFAIELIESSESDLRSSVGSGRIHMALLPLRPDERGAHIVSLYEEPLTMFVAADHPLAGRIEVGPEELAAETMIARRSCEFLDATSRFFTRHGVRPRFALRSESDERCLRMVAAGIGITTAPVSLAIDGIVPLKVAGYDFRRELGLVVDPAWAALPDVAPRLAHALETIASIAAEWREMKVAAAA
ncbi:DNA-binding transcriptional LysR family regulator [Sphingopyxis panaciterrae]|uniref:LysR family transcriptional regulator n=1 Tax=Sphingopyxis panaciterrae TaxID=363841 RepID=UPI001421EDEB|nr:LysR family transcriptional regulator [Sphingopyxis panaciterrae]NIJ36829.1 DNA-binding transcriptional LysR family regulator [Sphingopyxis panaciterrae]